MLGPPYLVNEVKVIMIIKRAELSLHLDRKKVLILREVLMHLLIGVSTEKTENFPLIHLHSDAGLV